MQPDAPIWNGLITLAGRAGQLQRAFQVLEDMQASNCKPNARTFAALIDACSRAENTEMGLRVYQVRVPTSTVSAAAILGPVPVRACPHVFEPDAVLDHRHKLHRITTMMLMPVRHDHQSETRATFVVFLQLMGQWCAATASDAGGGDVQSAGVRVGDRRLQELALGRSGRRTADLQRHATVRHSLPTPGCTVRNLAVYGSTSCRCVRGKAHSRKSQHCKLAHGSPRRSDPQRRYAAMLHSQQLYVQDVSARAVPEAGDLTRVAGVEIRPVWRSRCRFQALMFMCSSNAVVAAIT